MELKGENLAKIKKTLESNYSIEWAIKILIEMLWGIEEVHERGFIHRDVKASNFVMA
jgi:serine/threonine protein kinase